MKEERRATQRIPVDIPVTQYIDNKPMTSHVSDISSSGLQSQRTFGPMSRSSRHIQLEFSLPGVSEALWAKGEIVYDAIGPFVHGTGVRFVAMAPGHQKILQSWLEVQEQTLL